ncbi:hypothetical protein EVAR_22802_1 [Eumeta japonica]|uniref:Uncharacterized protein n=1 Tax=Eumeta variegata TaxID=151549 RepID=A0A4C1VG87_EUMVA|nr:hypothetical protein EVAR_22802_1 [Eumeta japonica]
MRLIRAERSKLIRRDTNYYCRNSLIQSKRGCCTYILVSPLSGLTNERGARGDRWGAARGAGGGRHPIKQQTFSPRSSYFLHSRANTNADRRSATAVWAAGVSRRSVCRGDTRLSSGIQTMIAGAEWFVKKNTVELRTSSFLKSVKNDLITRDLKVEPLENFIKMLVRRTFNRADAGPHASLHNLAPQCERPPGGHQLPRDLLPVPPNEDKV